MKEKTLVKKLKELVHEELKILAEYADRQRNNYKEVIGAIEVIQHSIRQLRFYRFPVKELKELSDRYVDIKSKCDEVFAQVLAQR